MGGEVVRRLSVPINIIGSNNSNSVDDNNQHSSLTISTCIDELGPTSPLPYTATSPYPITNEMLELPSTTSAAQLSPGNNKKAVVAGTKPKAGSTSAAAVGVKKGSSSTATSAAPSRSGRESGTNVVKKLPAVKPVNGAAVKKPGAKSIASSGAATPALSHSSSAPALPSSSASSAPADYSDRPALTGEDLYALLVPRLRRYTLSLLRIILVLTPSIQPDKLPSHLRLDVGREIKCNDSAPANVAWIDSKRHKQQLLKHTMLLLTHLHSIFDTCSGWLPSLHYRHILIQSNLPLLFMKVLQSDIHRSCRSVPTHFKQTSIFWPGSWMCTPLQLADIFNGLSINPTVGGGGGGGGGGGPIGMSALGMAGGGALNADVMITAAMMMRMMQSVTAEQELQLHLLTRLKFQTALQRLLAIMTAISPQLQLLQLVPTPLIHVVLLSILSIHYINNLLYLIV